MQPTSKSSLEEAAKQSLIPESAPEPSPEAQPAPQATFTTEHGTASLPPAPESTPTPAPAPDETPGAQIPPGMTAPVEIKLPKGAMDFINAKIQEVTQKLAEGDDRPSPFAARVALADMREASLAKEVNIAFRLRSEFKEALISFLLAREKLLGIHPELLAQFDFDVTDERKVRDLLAPHVGHHSYDALNKLFGALASLPRVRPMS